MPSGMTLHALTDAFSSRQRVGGLGNVAIQYANKFGYTVVAISRGPDKKEQALEYGVSGEEAQWWARQRPSLVQSIGFLLSLSLRVWHARITLETC